MAITQALLTAGVDTGTLKVYVTPSIAPAANALITVAVVARRKPAPQTPTLSGGGMAAWTLVTSVDYNSLGTPASRLMVFRALSAAPGSGPLTLTFANSQSNVQWSVSQWTGVDQTGTNGSGAIGQTGSARGDALSALSVALAAFGNANNVAYGLVGAGINGPAVTPGTGFTEITETSSGEGTLLETERAVNLNTVQASLSKAAQAGALGIEIKQGVTVAFVTVSPPSASVAAGNTVPLTATPSDASGKPLSGRIVTWQSDMPTVASVSASGIVTGVAEGSATIMATSEGQSGTSTITVTPGLPVAFVTVSPPSASVAAGNTVPLTATPSDASGNPLSGRIVTWQSDNLAVASVSASGIVTGEAEGSATITATSEDQSGTSTVTVTAATTGSTVLVGACDIASCSSSGDEATATLLDNIPGTVFTAGDNAYDKGSAVDYSQCYEPSWGRHKDGTRPAPGNHEYGTPLAAGYFEYYGNLAGTAGLGYYSYDLGAWHIISLNSNIPMSAGSPQEQWLRADLAASSKQCTIAMWHHPRFSSGTHHGSTVAAQALWQALYDVGAEIVISGHEHNYERFAPQTPSGQPDPVAGIREFVVGTGGASHYTTSIPLPTSEVFNGTTWGVLKLTLEPGTFSWQFIPIAGQTFTDAGSGTCHAPTSSVTASPTTITASNGSSAATITVTVRDASGNLVSGVPVDLTATGSGNTLTSATASTNANGVVTATLSSTVAETKIVSATINNVAIAQVASVTVSPAAAAALAFTVEPGSTLAGALISPAVQVEIRDQFGNRITGATSNVTLAIGANSPAGTLSGTATVAAVAGVAAFGNLHIDQPAAGYTLHATSGSLTDATSSVFDITGGSVSPTQSTVSADPLTFTAGSGASTIVVTAKDGSGNGVGDAIVSLSATGSGNSFVQPAPTGANGMATGTLRSTVAGVKSVTATVNGVIVSPKATVTVTPGPPSANISTVSANPTSVGTGGSSTITVTVKDAFGNPVGGSNVSLSASGTGNTFTPSSSGPTSGTGVFTASLTSTVLQTETVSATADGVLLGQKPTVTVTNQAITQALLSAGVDSVTSKIYVTPSIAPARNALITVAVLTRRKPAPQTPTLSGGGMSTWTLVASVDYNSIDTAASRLMVFRATSAAPGSGPLTMTFANSQSNVQWSVSQWTGVDQTGTNGSGAIGQTGSARSNAVSALSVPLAAFGNPNNVVYGMVGASINGPAVTPGTGFTEISETSSGESTLLETEWAVNLPTVQASLSKAAQAGALGIEIKAP